MADTSRSQVTITLGRSGQVVKRAGAVLDRELPDSVPAVGTKRPVRDRLGTSGVAVQLDNKRLRTNDAGWSLNGSNSIDDLHLSKDDLRFKIMKRTQNNGQQNTVDLRDLLSRKIRPSTSTNTVHEPRNERQRPPETRPDPRDERRHVLEPRNEPRFVSESPRDERRMEPRDQRRLEPRAERRLEPRAERRLEPRDDRPLRMVEPRDGGRHCGPEPVLHRVPPKMNDGRQQRVPESVNGSMTGGQFSSSMRSSDMDMLRNSYSSPWTLDHIRRKSPPPPPPSDRVMNNSRVLSPPSRRAEEPSQRRGMIRGGYEDHLPRTVNYATRDHVGEISRPPMTAATSFMTKPSLSAGPTKPVRPLAPPPQLPPGGVMQRNPYPVEEHVTVEGFLRSLGLDKYVLSFKVEEVDMAALSQMGDNDLKELGIPMGPRKKIMLALIARAKRQAR